MTLSQAKIWSKAQKTIANWWMARLWLKKKVVPSCDKPGLTARRFRPQDHRMRFLLERVFRKKIERGELKHLRIRRKRNQQRSREQGRPKARESKPNFFPTRGKGCGVRTWVFSSSLTRSILERDPSESERLVGESEKRNAKYPEYCYLMCSRNFGVINIKL